MSLDYPSAGFSDLDLDAVTVHQPRKPATGLNVVLDWAQETQHVKLFFPLVGPLNGMRARDLDVQVRAERLEISGRGKGGKLITGALGGRCNPDESEWEVISGELIVTLSKTSQREWLDPLDVELVAKAASSEPPRPTGGAPASSPMPHASSQGLPLPPTAPAAPTPAAPARVAVPTHPTPHSTQSPAAGPAARSSGSGLGAAYREWDRFDEHAALAATHNEGLNPEEPEWMARSGQGSVAIQVRASRELCRRGDAGSRCLAPCG